jgi:hypothetical protein
MCGSTRWTTSPSSSSTSRNTPCAAGCCGPKLRVKLRKAASAMAASRQPHVQRHAADTGSIYSGFQPDRRRTPARALSPRQGGCEPNLDEPRKANLALAIRQPWHARTHVGKVEDIRWWRRLRHRSGGIQAAWITFGVFHTFGWSVRHTHASLRGVARRSSFQLRLSNGIRGSGNPPIQERPALPAIAKRSVPQHGRRSKVAYRFQPPRFECLEIIERPLFRLRGRRRSSRSSRVNTRPAIRRTGL